jgi:hypothetical protein
MWPLLVLTVLVVAAVLLLRGPPELAKLEVRGGNVRLTRGRLPGRLVDDFDDILKNHALESGVLRIVVEDARPRLLARGLGPVPQQQLRNVLGPYSVAQLRAGQRTAARRT